MIIEENFRVVNVHIVYMYYLELKLGFDTGKEADEACEADEAKDAS